MIYEQKIKDQTIFLLNFKDGNHFCSIFHLFFNHMENWLGDNFLIGLYADKTKISFNMLKGDYIGRKILGKRRLRVVDV